MDFLFRLFDPTGFPARWRCGPAWSETPWLGWLHILSDLGIWTAYFAIPLVLAFFILRKQDLPFRRIFLLFGAFILLCGLTHLLEAVIFWWPIYRFAGALKLVTAVVSWGTVFALVRIVPKVLAMRTPEELEREITGRRAAEASLQQANSELERRVAERTDDLYRAMVDLAAERELLRTTLGSIGDAVIATDTEGRVTFLNAVAQELTGWSSAEAVTTPLESVFHIVNETSREPVENPAMRALRDGAIVGLANHTVLIAKDGREYPIDDSAAPIRYGQDKIAGAVLVFRDITERKSQEAALRRAHDELQQRLQEHTSANQALQGEVVERQRAEEQLRESESRFRQLADAMPQIVWVTRPDGYHEYYNRRWYDYIGCTPQECIGFGWNAPLHPDDRQRSIDRWAYSLETGEPYEVEYRFRSHAGEYRWFLARALPVRNEQGQIVKWFGTCTDIEDFKRIEGDRQKFVSLAEQSTDFIGICNLEGIPSYINPAGLQMVGLDSLAHARRTPVREFFFPEDQSMILHEYFPAVLREGHGEVEVRFRDFRTQQAIWVIYKVFCLTDAQGERVLATVSRDITQRRQLEDDLRQLAANLSEADRRKDEFLATLAHELRNPLAPISNGLQILKLTDHGGKAIEQARVMMERQLAQMVRLVDDLLDVSRITRNKLELRKQRLDLNAVIQSAIETSRPLIEANGHEFDLNLPENAIHLNGDPVRLAQVFSNLLNNAAKYTERGGRIWLSATCDDREIHVSVKDTGVGIPPAMLPRVFDIFTQVDRTLERAQGGLGIGLTLVRRLVEMHGGSVEAKSDGYGEGSEFIVHLPLPELTPARSSNDDDSRHFTALTQRRILVVDDNQDAANSLSTLLEMMGNEVRVVHDGQAAVDEARNFRPDIVLLDIGMPKLNGYEACRLIRQQADGPQPIIIACTGWGQEEDRRRSEEAGFNHHMVKPIDPQALQRLLVHP